ncbi:hypothetical protein MNB_ARC-1_615 [hydrothermal vent metagenome]|uniref:Phosphoribosyltransferase domain-containing protein n=1 Tax=hydrothermal vent metagenome TaxID=652676 RepID=A0A3B1EA48_9ZZZZ
MDKKLFKNREDALEKLSKILPLNQMNEEPWIIIAVSASAVPIAFGLSKKLNIKFKDKQTFDFMFTHKINTPNNDECELAIITETKDIIIHKELMESFEIELDDIYAQANETYDKNIQQYIKQYRDGKPLVDMKNKNVLLVDEGLNTSLTMMACIKSAISCGVKSVAVAVPVLPKLTIIDIELITDDIYFVKAPAHFVTIDFYYDKLPDVDLELIKNITKEDIQCQ